MQLGAPTLGNRYNIDILRHSKEPEQLKSFVNLDGQKLGIEFNEELTRCRFFIYADKKAQSSYDTDWISLDDTLHTMKSVLFDMVRQYYKDKDRLIRGDLPMYTRLELQIPAVHLYYHANAGTLPKLFEREIIYF